jgi:hypothetical protein
LSPGEERVDQTGSGLRGVDQFSIYLMHDQQEATLDAYGESVIPALG